MSEGIRIESDRRTRIEAETIRAGFLDQGFINTMRFSELNGPEEYDNTHLYIDWRACFGFGMQQLSEWKEWIKRQKDDPELWKEVPEQQKKSIERTLLDMEAYDFTKPFDDKNNIKVIRDRLAKYNINLVGGMLVYDGQTGILNGRMARDKGHKKDLLKVTENRKEHDREIEIGQEQKKRFGLF
jgi:hypothetical protein